MQAGFSVASSKGNISNPVHCKLHDRRVNHKSKSSVISTIRAYILDATCSLGTRNIEYVPHILSRISAGISQRDGSPARAQTDTGIISIVV